MSVARLDLERLIGHNKREIEKILETTIRSMFIKSFGAIKGGSKFNELASKVSDALMIDRTRYRTSREYLSALRVYTLGAIFLAKVLSVVANEITDAGELSNFVNDCINAISMAAPNGNMLLLYREMKRILDEKLSPNQSKRILLAVVFEYFNTILKSISIKSLSQPEKELLSHTVISMIKDAESPLITLDTIHAGLGIPMEYGNFVKLIKELSSLFPEIVMIKADGKVWVSTKEKIDNLMAEIKKTVIEAGIADTKKLTIRFPYLSSGLLLRLMKMISDLDKDFIFKRIRFKRVLMHYPKDPEAYARRVVEEGIKSTRDMLKKFKEEV